MPTLLAGCLFDAAPLLSLKCDTDLDCEELGANAICQQGYCRSERPAGACLEEEGACDNGQFCDGVERCAPDEPGADERGCLPGDPVDLDDGITCTVGRCDELADAVVQDCSTCECCGNTGSCSTEPAPACSAWVCSALHTCALIPAPQGEGCDDGVGCTGPDTCNGQGQCVGAPDDAACDDGAFCTGQERCLPGDPGADVRGCLLGAPPAIEDDLPCSEDACDEEADRVVHDTSGCLCDSDDDCETTSCMRSRCEEGLCAFELLEIGEGCDDGVDCTVGDVCDGAQRCVGRPDPVRCDDGAFCNGQEQCLPADPRADGGGCVEGEVPEIDDGIDCTQDGCDEEEDQIVHEDQDCECEGDDDCEGESCAVGRCEARACTLDPAPVGTPCDDEVDCTGDDACDEQQRCVGVPDDGACSGDGEPCNGVERCAPDAPGADDEGCGVDPEEPLPLACIPGPAEVAGLTLWLDADDPGTFTMTRESGGHSLRGDSFVLGGSLSFSRTESASPRPGRYFVYPIGFTATYGTPPQIEIETPTGTNFFRDTFEIEARNATVGGFELFVYRTDDPGEGFGKGPDDARWRTAEAGLVQTWADKGAGSRHATQSASERRPTRREGAQAGRALVRFEDDWMDFSRPARDDMSIAVLIRTTDGRGDDNWWECPAIIGGELAGVVDDLGLVLREGRAAWAARDNGFDVQTDRVGELSDGQAHLIVLTRDKNTGAVVLRVDGQERARGTGVNNRLDSNSFLRLARHPTGSGALNAEYGEVLIFDRVLDAAQIEQVEAYMNFKWGL